MQRVWTEIDRIADDWVDASVAMHPEDAVVLGRPGYPGLYSDYSPAGLDASADAAAAALRRIKAAGVADEVDAVTKADLTRTLELELERHAARVALRDVNSIESPVQRIRDVLDLEPTATADDWSTIALRLGNVRGALAGYTARLRSGIAEGIVPARRQVLLAAEQSGEFAAPGGYFETLAGGAAEHGAAVTRDVQAAARDAAGAYMRLAAFLRERLAPVAGEGDAVGRAAYALASREFLGATVDLDETYEWGVEELARMTEQQEAVARRIVPGGSVERAIRALDEDPAAGIEGTAALQAWMQRTSDAAIDALAGVHFDIPGPVRTLECRIAPTHSGVIYYTPPSDDFSRPGRMWWSVPDGVTRFSPWRERTTVYHEGVPGHHLQIATAVHNREALNTWRRTAGTSGYWEGWALYAERLMGELGFLDDPADALGMLDGQRMRAARVVIDIGVHLGKRRPDGGVWDRASALALLREHVHMDDAFLRFEVDRYLGWPGQAASYKVGQRIWEQVRDEARIAAGAGWDLREFHRRALTMGGLGLGTLRGALLGTP